MITTEFGRLVATGGAEFTFMFLMSYLQLRRKATKPATPKSCEREGWGTQAIGRAR